MRVLTLDYNDKRRVELRAIIDKTQSPTQKKIKEMINKIGNTEKPDKYKILTECKKIYALKLAKEIKDKDTILKIVEQMDGWDGDKLNKWLIDNK
jgi:hypothetical protein